MRARATAIPSAEVPDMRPRTSMSALSEITAASFARKSSVGPHLRNSPACLQRHTVTLREIPIPSRGTSVGIPLRSISLPIQKPADRHPYAFLGVAERQVLCLKLDSGSNGLLMKFA